MGLAPRWRVLQLPSKLTGEPEPALIFDRNGDGHMSAFWVRDLIDDIHQLGGFFGSLTCQVPTGLPFA